ncbi:Putative ribonuclease H protein At1g65750 [Linum perenne]
MQTSVLPATTCDSIDRRVRNFVWGSTSEERKVLQAKYFKETLSGLQSRKLASKSSLWRGITKAWPDMLRGSRSGLRDGQNTSFWLGRWLDSGDKLIDFVTSPTELLDLDASVSSFVKESGVWDVDSFRPFLPAESILQITSMLPPARGRGDDTWNWGEEPNGNFSIRSAYRLTLELDLQTSVPDWKCLWRWRGPSRVQLFLWLAMHNKLLTNSERKRRHLTEISNCPRCNLYEESASHILRECHYSVAVWTHLGLREFCSSHDNFCSWLSKDWKHAVELTQSQSAILGSQPLGRRIVAIEWDPGPEGWVTVNTDGSVARPSGNASAGGLIRDHLGHCSLAFSANLGRCSITRAELRGILHGLEFSWTSGHKKVRLQTDSQSAASLILADDPPLHQHASEVLAIRELLQRNWQVDIHHIFREGNGAADFLANMGHCFDPGIQIVPTSDCNLGYFLRKDCMRIAELRMISILN